MKKIIIILVFLVNIQISKACINGMWLSDGTVLREGSVFGAIPNGHDFINVNFEELLKKFDSLYIKTKNVDYLSDYGTILIFQGKYTAAESIYVKIEGIKPNRYETAANLGTTYELLGKNELALKWIKRAIQLDSTSHFGSEWIHVKILEAKICGETCINSQSLLKTNFGNELIPKSKLSQDELQDLRKQLFYQLNERVTFIKSNDKIVGCLLSDLGNINYLLGDKQTAKMLYAKAIEYGYRGGMVVKKVKELSGTIVQNQKPKSTYNVYVWIVIAGIVLCVVFILVYKRNRKKK